MNEIIKFIAASLTVAALTFFSNDTLALLDKHECGFCHSLHGSDTGFVPRSDSLNLEVLCMGCHLTANGTTAAVQPHRTDGTYAEHYITCYDCHDVHDNQPNWRLNDPNHVADDNLAGRDGTDIRPDGWPVGVNTMMLGRKDPDGETPYAIIITKEKDFNKDGIPDRGTVTQTCNASILNDCYVTDKRHVIFENRDTSLSDVSIHGWADNNEDGMSPADAVAWGETITEFGDPLGAPMDSACNMCHTQTSKNACGYVGAPNCGPHQIVETCTNCHTHAGCFDKGGTCTKWTMPDRDIRMDSVSAAPTTVDVGQTVTITAEFTNLGTIAEEVRVKFYSSVEGFLGFMDVSDVAASGGTGQADFGWETTSDGTHTVSAEAQPVLGEVIVTNNEATGNTVTVGTVDQHDVAVTSVLSPSPIQQGDTETVSVELANLGTYTEGPFDVTLTSGRDGLIGTVTSGTLAPGATPTLNFSWDTTVASMGTHTLTAAFVTFTDDVPGNDSNDTTAVVAIHDVAVTNVTAPATVYKGTTVSVDVDISNLSVSGGFTESFNVTLSSDLDGVIQVLSSGSVAPGATPTLNFNWNTAGVTSIGTHTLTATAETVTGETITGNNSSSAVAEVAPPVNRDVELTSVTAPATVDRGTSPTITVRVTNNGSVTETFNVTLSSDLDGQIQVLSSGVLLADNFVDLDFTWTTDSGTSLGLHTLTAVADTVTGETNTADNTNSTTSTVTTHDVAVDSVTAPASTAQGSTAAIDVDISNVGSFTETFNVTLYDNTDDPGHASPIQTLSSGSLSPSGTTTLNFSWDTTGASVGNHTLEAIAETVSGETNTANNSATTMAEITANVTHDVAVNSVTASPNPLTAPATATFTVEVENLGSVSESIDLSLVSNILGSVCEFTNVVLAANTTSTTEFQCTRDFRKNEDGTHNLTATATIAIDDNVSNNVGVGSLQVDR